MVKKKVEEVVVEETPKTTAEKTYKEELLELYNKLKELGVNSISDLEVLIAKA